MKETKQILEDAYHLLDDKKRCTQGRLAKSLLGVPVGAKDSRAVCWCAVGAVSNASKADSEFYSSFRKLDTACNDLYQAGPFTVNDELGYRAIRRAFRKAIKDA